MGQERRVWEAAAALAGVLLAGILLVPRPVDKLVFLDVGQGDSILFQDSTAQILVDGGAGMKVVERLGEEMPWFDKTIEVVVSTHPDRDHLEGLLHVLERYEVQLVLLPEISHDSQLYKEWLTRLQHSKDQGETEYRFASQGQKLEAGDLVIEILGPSAEVINATRPGKTNNASVITRADFHQLSFLLTGDAEAGIESALVRKYDPLPPQTADSPFIRGRKLLNVDVLKAGHHGSKTSTSQVLLDAVSPSAVVISVGADNSYGHPHPIVLSRLANYQTWRTDQHGSVKFIRTDDQWLLKTTK